jgi:YcaO-like protein with predicted kinase domain
LNNSWVLPPCPANARGWRRYHAEEFLPIAAAEAARLGAIRPASLSGLDELGVPCWQIARPDAVDTPGNVSLLTGKGWTNDQALLGAYMEAIERHWAECSCVTTIVAKPSELQARGEWYVPLSIMPLPMHISDPGDQPLAWVRGTTLEGKSILVPAHEVWCPFLPSPGICNPAIWHSTGLASGSHLTEAVFHGLLEIIERDAMAVAELYHVGQSVELSEIGSTGVQELSAVLSHQGMTIEVKSLTSIGGVYTFVAFLDDPMSQNPLRINGGHSAHLDPMIAIEDAILEAAQSRAVFVAGGREDLALLSSFASLGYSAARDAMAWWLAPTSEKVPAPCAPGTPQDLACGLRQISDRLREKKFWPIIFVPLSPPEANIVAVRVLVPTCSQVSSGNMRLGRSVLERAFEPIRERSQN